MANRLRQPLQGVQKLCCRKSLLAAGRRTPRQLCVSRALLISGARAAAASCHSAERRLLAQVDSMRHRVPILGEPDRLPDALGEQVAASGPWPSCPSSRQFRWMHRRRRMLHTGRAGVDAFNRGVRLVDSTSTTGSSFLLGIEAKRCSKSRHDKPPIGTHYRVNGRERSPLIVTGFRVTGRNAEASPGSAWISFGLCSAP